jgi:hypothetical protein
MREDAGVAINLERLGPTSCAWCGVAADELPVTWTAQTGPRGVEYLCERCTRDNARNIEGQLPTAWW